MEKKLSEPKLGDVEFDVILKLDMPVPAKLAGLTSVYKLQFLFIGFYFSY